MISKIKAFFSPAEKRKILLFCFGYGLFADITIQIIIGLIDRAAAGRIDLDGWCVYPSCTIGLITATIFLIPGHLWYKRKMSRGAVSYKYSIFLWGITLAFRPFVTYVYYLKDMLYFYTVNFIIIVIYSFLYFVCGCFLGLAAPYLLGFKKKEVLAFCFIVAWILYFLSPLFWINYHLQGLEYRILRHIHEKPPSGVNEGEEVAPSIPLD